MVSESEVRDTIQVAADATVDHLGRIATIIAGAVRDIAVELGSWANDVLEARDAAQRSRADEEPTVVDAE
jgi:hypothetical protein